MMSDRRFWAVGLDVGGTKIAGGTACFPSGRIGVRSVVPTRPDRSGEEVLSDCVRIAQKLASEASKTGVHIQAVGIGIPELVDRQGHVTSGFRLDWRDLPVLANFSPIAPAVVQADVRAAALAESLLGAGKDLELFIYVTVGTGISYCLVQHGQPYAGARGNAELFASSPWVSQRGASGSMGLVSIEDLASGPSLVTRYNVVSASYKALSAEDVIMRVGCGDASAIAVVQDAAEALGMGVGLLVDILDPLAVVVGGGLGLAGGFYWETFTSVVRRHIWADNTRTLPIVPAGLGTDAGWLGAAAYAWQHHGKD